MTAPITKPSPAMEKLGPWLREKRIAQGLTVLHVACETRMSESVVRRVEAGGGCTVDTMNKIAKALKVSCSLAFVPLPPGSPVESCYLP